MSEPKEMELTSEQALLLRSAAYHYPNYTGKDLGFRKPTANVLERLGLVKVVVYDDAPHPEGFKRYKPVWSWYVTLTEAGIEEAKRRRFMPHPEDRCSYPKICGLHRPELDQRVNNPFADS